MTPRYRDRTPFFSDHTKYKNNKKTSKKAEGSERRRAKLKDSFKVKRREHTPKPQRILGLLCNVICERLIRATRLLIEKSEKRSNLRSGVADYRSGRK